MKKVKTGKWYALIAMSMSLIISSCEKKENISPIDISPIVGVWAIDVLTMNITVDGVSYVDYFIDFYITEYGITQEEAEAVVLTSLSEVDNFQVTPEGSFELEANGTFEFKNDGTFLTNIDGDKNKGSWTLVGDVLSTFDETDSEMVIFDVITRNATTLVFEGSVFENWDNNADGIDEVMEWRFTYSLTR